MTAWVILALGVGVTTAMFSVIDALLLQQSPWPAADHLVIIHAVRPDQRHNPALADSWNRAPISWAAWRDLESSPAFQGVGVWLRRQQILGADRSEIVTVYYASSSFTGVLGVKPALGRLFDPKEDGEMSDSAIISHETWRRRFGGRADIIGQTIALAYTHDSASVGRVIVGILPPGFRFQGESPDVLLPIGLMAFNGSFEANRFLRAVGRLAPTVSREQAEAMADPLVRRTESRERRTARVVSLIEDEFGAIARPLWLLLGAAAMLLVISCSNVASLLLADGRARRPEMATRIALGATRPQLARQLLAESLLLALAASATGVLLAYWFTPALGSMAPPAIRAIGPVSVSLRIASWCLAVGSATALCFGISPVVRLLTASARRTVVEDARGLPTRRAAVAGQLALALVLAVAAGMFGDALLRVRSHPLGFEPTGLAVATVRMTSTPRQARNRSTPADRGNATRASAQAARNAGWMYTAGILERLEALPGVVAAAGASVAPFAGTAPEAILRERGDAPDELAVQWRAVTEGYFRTMGIPIVAGRGLAATDRDYGQPFWAVISTDGRPSATANAAVGKDLIWGQSSPLRVVGVAAQVQHQPSDRLFQSPSLYLINFRVDQIGCFLVRTAGDPHDLLPAMRQAIESDGSVRVTATSAMADLVADSMAPEQFRALLATSFGAVALVLAAVGLFGLMSYMVARRRQEIAVRMALGAGPAEIRQLVFRDAALIVGGGIAVGVPAASAIFSIIRAIPVVSPAVPATTLLSAVAVVVAASMAAVMMPVLRAARIDPAELLRS